ncbi:MAG TPA: drug/metabolite exporter YedA, partial [Chloroflexota bacterium]
MNTPPARSPADRFGVGLALFALYIIWGSTYLAIRITVHGFPPLLMMGERFLLAGGILYAVLRLRGYPAPSRREWAGSFVVGALLLLGGNGMVAVAEQKVPSSLTATMIATVPLWAAVFSGFWGRWPTRVEVSGLALGFAGVVLLNLEGSLRADPVGAAILVVAATCWAFGSVWGTHLQLPSGLMAGAAEMLMGGCVIVLAGAAHGEHPVLPTGHSLLALLYLVVFGSLIAFSAYAFLLQRVRPALATSYAYVNPVVAVLLGVGLAREHVG